MYKIKKFESRYNVKMNEFIISILVEEFGFEECRKELEEQNNEEYMQKGGYLWMALDDKDNVIGTIALKKHNENEAELKKLYVKKDYRGKGLSKELYNIFLQQAQKDKYNRIFLGTYDKLETAIKFYLKRGFKQMDKLSEEKGAKYFEMYI